MENQKEKILNRLYQQLTEIYYLKGVCLAILKDLEQKENLTEKEEHWKTELLAVLVDPEEI